jgi:hypothetical protein
MKTKPTTLGKNKIVYILNEYMDARGLSILGTSRKCGLSYGTVFDLYHNRSIQIRKTTLEKLYDGIGADIADVIRRAG